MKHLKILIAVFIVAIGSSCNETPEDTSDVVSSWKLIEQLMDPGDGSGTFQPVVSDKSLTFFADGTFSTENGSVCVGDWQSNSTSSGTYSESTMIMMVDNCTGGHVPLSYEMDGAFLILNYACIEPCREKYEQVD